MRSIGAFFDGYDAGAPAEDAAVMYQQMIQAAAAAMKSRPTFVKKLSPEKRAAAMRRALARVGADPLAEEMLAIYFLEVRQSLLTSCLDSIGLEHEDGSLKEDAPAQPDEKKLVSCVEEFRKGDDPGDRELLLQAFAAQSSIDWPKLDELLAG